MQAERGSREILGDLIIVTGSLLVWLQVKKRWDVGVVFGCFFFFFVFFCFG